MAKKVLWFTKNIGFVESDLVYFPVSFKNKLVKKHLGGEAV